MKFRNIGRVALAAAVSAGLALGIAACGRTNTIDYLFVASAGPTPGKINAYLVDGTSGVLTQVPGSPYTAGNDPVTLVTSPDQKFLYVLNHGDNTIVSYAIGDAAVLTKANTYTTPGTNPTSMKINSAGTLLFVTDAFQPQYSATSPGPGALVVYPINSDGSLGTPVTDSATGKPYFAVCNNPVDLTVLQSGVAVYVIDDPAPGGQPPKLAASANPTAYIASGACVSDSGQINAFNIGSGGALTPVTGSPFAAGVTPTAIASDPTDRFVYVTDLVSNELLAYTTLTDNGLSAVNNGPFVTNPYPDAVTVDPRGLYVYVANYNGGSISSYSIVQATGVPTATSGTTANNVTAGPTFVFIEPNAGKYLYSADFVDNTVFGSVLNANTGALEPLQNAPYPTAGGPTAIAGVTHGNHPTEVLPQY
jgi:6-phosphogluconolactonase (cycloisomerase 2 family)